MRSRRVDSVSDSSPAMSTILSVNSSVLKLRAEISRVFAASSVRLTSSPVRESWSSRSPPRSPIASIMESPARPSASVMCSPFSASERVMRWAASLTLLDTSSLTEVMSWVSPKCTLLSALRTWSAWFTRASRWLARSSISPRMRSSLSL